MERPAEMKQGRERGQVIEVRDERSGREPAKKARSTKAHPIIPHPVGTFSLYDVQPIARLYAI
jgi:hypothetical protein